MISFNNNGQWNYEEISTVTTSEWPLLHLQNKIFKDTKHDQILSMKISNAAVLNPIYHHPNLVLHIEYWSFQLLLSMKITSPFNHLTSNTNHRPKGECILKMKLFHSASLFWSKFCIRHHLSFWTSTNCSNLTLDCLQNGGWFYWFLLACFSRLWFSSL
jgi:hypothetical protein